MREPDDLSFIKSDIRLEDVPPLNRRRVIAFVNAFTRQTLTFLNDFAARTEAILLRAERDLDNAQLKLRLLEAKLDSVPELKAIGQGSAYSAQTIYGTQASAVESTTLSSLPEVTSTSATAATNAIPPSVQQPAPPPPPPPSSSAVDAQPKTTVKDDPTYAKYFRMLKMGVPEAAVRLKMQSEGVNPVVLDNPDAVVTRGNEKAEESDEDGSESSGSSVANFTDSD